MHRTLTLSILACFLLSVSGIGCSSKGSGKIKITIWHQMRIDERVILQSQIEKFMALHPDVEVEQLYKETEELRSGFIVAAIAGQGPELVYGPSDQVGPFQVMDIILPLENLFDSTYLAAFNPKALTYYKGHLYQIADKLGNHLTLVYNKKLLKVPPKTDVELIADGERLTKDLDGDGRPDQFGLVWNYTEPFFFIPFMSGFGGWVMDDKGNPTLDSKGTIEGLKFIQELRDKYKIIPREADYNIADILFKDGKAAMIINGDWSWSGYQKAGIDIGVAPLPKIVSTGLWCSPMISPKGFSINANVTGEKKKWTVELLKFLLSPSNELETAKSILTMPTLKSLYTNDFIEHNEIMQNSQIQIDRGRLMPVVPEMRAIWDSMRPSYQAVLNGTKTPEQAAHDMQQEALQRIKEMNE
ncbi:MAG TPA: extracellular solute-binding protein [Bacteroidota bacterium]|nr:extracellular solute-binding protein [Bacteroidota bacterium]